MEEVSQQIKLNEGMDPGDNEYTIAFYEKLQISPLHQSLRCAAQAGT